MTDQEKMTRILGDIITITDRQSLKTIKNTAGSRMDEIATVETALWNIGDEVQLLPEHQGRRPYGAVGTIKKINKVRIRVAFPSGTWNVPKLMLMKAK